MHNSCRLCENSESRGSHAIIVRYMPSRGKDITPRSLYSALILLVAVTVLSFHTVCLNFEPLGGRLIPDHGKGAPFIRRVIGLHLGTSRDALLRQGDELRLVAGYLAEASGLPVGLGLLDPLAAGGDEVPEQVPRPVHSAAAQQQHPRGPARSAIRS